jgi:hypothetical protein
MRRITSLSAYCISSCPLHAMARYDEDSEERMRWYLLRIEAAFERWFFSYTSKCVLIRGAAFLLRISSPCRDARQMKYENLRAISIHTRKDACRPQQLMQHVDSTLKIEDWRYSLRVPLFLRIVLVVQERTLFLRNIVQCSLKYSHCITIYA